MKYRLFILFLIFCFAFTSAAFGQDLVKDSIKVQKIITDAGKGRKAPAMFTITDKEKVSVISAYINAKKLEVKSEDEKQKAIYSQALGRRYKNGDKSTIPEILSILKEKNRDKINNLFNELENDSFVEENVSVVLDPEVKAEVFNLVTNPGLEHLAVQFIGFNKIDDYVPLFEKRLLSGRSTDADRILFWLSREECSQKVVDYIIGLLKPDIWVEDMNWIDASLESLTKRCPKENKEKLLSAVYTYLDKNPVQSEDFNRSSNILGNSSLKIKLLDFVMKHGDRRTLPIAEQLKIIIIEKSPEDVPAIEEYLERLMINNYDDARKRKIVEKGLDNSESFFETIALLRDNIALTNEPKIKNKIFHNLGKFRFYRSYDVECVAKLYPSMDKEEFSSLVEKNISDGKLKEKILKNYTLYKQTVRETDQYLIKLGLLDATIVVTPKSNSLDEDEFGDGAIYQSLRKAGIVYNFDVEAGDYPVRHDLLLNDFVSITRGKLTGIIVYQQSRLDDSGENSTSHLFAVYKGKAYIMMPEDFGDWYDLDTFTQLMDAIVADSGIKERFVSLDTGDQTASFIFGEPEKVAKLAKDYNLNNEETMQWLEKD